jgi:hypothetical protein
MHFYSLTKLQPHPLAKEHILTFPYRLSDNRCSPFISVMDDMVCLHASTAGEGSPEGGIGIWDWKRGVAVSVRFDSCQTLVAVDADTIAFWSRLGSSKYLVRGNRVYRVHRTRSVPSRRLRLRGRGSSHPALRKFLASCRLPEVASCAK